MPKLLPIITVMFLLFAPYPALAENKPMDGASAETEYRQSVKEKELRGLRRAIRADIRKLNSALAASLGKTGDYDESEVRKRHAELMDAEARLANAELEAMLLYKQRNPDWKPSTSGKKVVSGDPQKARKEKSPPAE